MDVVHEEAALLDNVERLASYFGGDVPENAAFARGLIERGICFVVTEDDRGCFFSPSRFVGYEGNSKEAHLGNADKDGRVTTPAISKLVGEPPAPDQKLEEEYLAFCHRIGVEPNAAAPFSIRRKFWDLRGRRREAGGESCSVSPSGVKIFKDFRDALIVDRYDHRFLGMRGSKLSQMRSENSEDALTWNVFRSLAQVDPEIWRDALFERAFGKKFPHRSDTLVIDLWRTVSAPPAIRHHQRDEGDSEIDIVLESENLVWFIEAKYKSDISTRTTANEDRDQLLRNIDVGSWHSSPRDFFFSLLVLSEDRSRTGAPLLRDYADSPHLVAERLPHRIDSLRNVRGVSLITWSDLASVLDFAAARARRPGEHDVAHRAIGYLSHKGIKPAAR